MATSKLVLICTYARNKSGSARDGLALNNAFALLQDAIYQ